MNEEKIIAFDLDDVLCRRSNEYEYLGVEKYDYCEPIISNIELMNSYYGKENFIVVVYTARGMSQFKGDVNMVYNCLFKKTKNQLIGWGAKFDRLIMGKIHYHVLIDDKALNSEKINSEKIDNIIYERFDSNIHQ